MKIIKNTIVKILRWATNNDVSKNPEVNQPISMSKAAYGNAIGSSRPGPDTIGMNFTIFNAVGGKVIQFNRYNPATDRSYNQLYIVTDKESLGEEIGQILTVESLSQ